MKRDLQALGSQEYDLVIIGGGIFGACAAWDATLRGLSVALLEKSDFCQATSAHHFKLIHGGVRYLQHLDFYRARISSRERSTLVRIAPHLAYPLPFMMPTYGHGMKGKEILRTGFSLYDFLTIDRNRAIEDPAREFPRARSISAEEFLEHCPGLRQKKNLTGGVIFYDGQIYNPSRLAISFLRSSTRAGLNAANYLEVTRYIRNGNRIAGVGARDILTGDELEIRSKCVLNTAGPWAHQLNEEALRTEIGKRPTFSRDLAMVIGRPLTKKYAFSYLTESRDSDSVLHRGGRHIFVIPWRELSLVGVWHRVWENSADEIVVTTDEILQFISEVNKINVDYQVSLDDVTMINTGLILFGDKHKQGTNKNHSFANRPLLVDHATQHQRVQGLVSLIGERATMARRGAEKTIDLILKKLARKGPKSKTANIPIYGGEIHNFEELVKDATAQLDRSKTVMRALVHNYGSEYRAVLKYCSEDPTLADAIGNSTVIKAEIIHAVREEMALKLEDVVFRRTDLGTGISPGAQALEACADVMGTELGWGKDRVREEVSDVEAIFSRRGPWKVSRHQQE